MPHTDKGGSHEQPGKAGQQAPKTAGSQSGAEHKADDKGGSRMSGSHDQHGKPADHKNK